MRRFSIAVLLMMAVLQAAPALGQCAGDCHGDGEVTVDELITGVNIALGSATLTQCMSLDTNGDGDVTINELISAVNNSLSGCPTSQPTPTSTPTPVSDVTPTPTTGIVPPGISTRMPGIWSGLAADTTTWVRISVRIKIEVVGGAVVVSDLGGNLFTSGPRLTVLVTKPTAFVYTKNIGSFPRGYLETLQLTLGPNGSIAGTYGHATLSLPPVVTTIGIELSKEP